MLHLLTAAHGTRPTSQHVRDHGEFWKGKRTSRGSGEYCYTFGTMNAQIERRSRPCPRHTWQVILTRLNLLALEKVACRDVEPAGNCLHQLIAGNREAIHVAAAD